MKRGLKVPEYKSLVLMINLNLNEKRIESTTGEIKQMLAELGELNEKRIESLRICFQQLLPLPRPSMKRGLKVLFLDLKSFGLILSSMKRGLKAACQIPSYSPIVSLAQ